MAQDFPKYLRQDLLRLETWRTEKAPDTEVRGQERSRAQWRERERGHFYF